jgi:tripartite-type tricarboxylate transporter receptor subunit TctC
MGSAAASAQSVGDFYRGKVISMIIPSGVGGGYDLYARYLARFIGKHIPGAPTVVVKNIPGAGGVVAANNLYSIAAPDGLTFGELQNTITLNQLAKTPSIKFDVRKFRWIGSMSTASTICALSGKAKDLSAEDLFHTEVVIGGSGGSSIMIPTLLNSLAGTHFKVVQGYESTSNVQLAMENGEVEGLCGWSWDGARVNAKEMLARGVARVNLDIAIQPQPELKADGVPFLMNFLPEGENKDVLTIILSTQVYNRPFAFPPGVSDDRVQALRDAFTATLQDPDFQKEADKIGLDVEYLPAKKIEELIDSVFDAPVVTQQHAVEELTKAGFGGS